MLWCGVLRTRQHKLYDPQSLVNVAEQHCSGPTELSRHLDGNQ
jgi:hypothetical protein